jgi:hypothetical protein
MGLVLINGKPRTVNSFVLELLVRKTWRGESSPAERIGMSYIHFGCTMRSPVVIPALQSRGAGRIAGAGVQRPSRGGAAPIRSSCPAPPPFDSPMLRT